MILTTKESTEHMVRKLALKKVFEVGDIVVNRYDGRLDSVSGTSSDNLLILKRRGEGFHPYDWKKI